MTWIYRGATDLADAIARGEVSSEEVVRAHLDRIDAVNAPLNAVVVRLDEEALAEARRADAELRQGRRRGPLHGVPVTLKESLSLAGKVTSCGSMQLRHNLTPESATAVARLQGAGAIPIGRTNVHDMGMDSQTHNLIWGVTRNPWDLTRTPGGSSGGEAAAIAAGMSPLGLGSDVAGSIRTPAAFCGILGLKPTQHRVSIAGHVPLTLHDYLQIGPLARSVDDLEVALRVIAGPDGKQSMVPPVPLEDSRTRLDRTLRIGVVAGAAGIPISGVVKAGLARATDAASDIGHDVEVADFPHPEDVIVCLARIFGVCLADLRRNVREHPEAYHPYLAEMSAVLEEPTVQALAEALDLRESLRARMMACFARYDVLLLPQVSVPAFPIGPSMGALDVDGSKVSMLTTLVYCFLINATGNPSLVIPTGVFAGLPVGVQLVGRMWDEPTLFALARSLLAELGGVPRPPELARTHPEVEELRA